MNLREKILNAIDIQEEIVEIPEWGVKVLVRGLTAEDRALVLQKATDLGGKVNYDKLYASLVILSAYDPETKERIFEESDRDAIMKKSASAIDKIVNTAMRLSGIGKLEEERIEKN